MFPDLVGSNYKSETLNDRFFSALYGCTTGMVYITGQTIEAKGAGN